MVDVCPVCHEIPIVGFADLNCGHRYCHECIKKQLTVCLICFCEPSKNGTDCMQIPFQRDIRCPSCRAVIISLTLEDGSTYGIIPEEKVHYEEFCCVCNREDRGEHMLICDQCNRGM